MCSSELLVYLVLPPQKSCGVIGLVGVGLRGSRARCGHQVHVFATKLDPALNFRLTSLRQGFAVRRSVLSESKPEVSRIDVFTRAELT
jgi:hypothetical protein